MKTHVVYIARTKKALQIAVRYLRYCILLPHTKIHVRRGNRVVVNAYTLLEAFRLIEMNEEAKKAVASRNNNQ